VQKPRRISGTAALECTSCNHKWDEQYSVRMDENGNPDINQLNCFLKKRRLVCPKCQNISFKILRIIVSLIH